MASEVELRFEGYAGEGRKHPTESRDWEEFDPDGLTHAFPTHPHQNWDKYETRRPKRYHHLAPDAKVIGRRDFRIKAEIETLNLVEISFLEATAYALLSDDELRGDFPLHTVAPSYALDEDQTRMGHGHNNNDLKYRQLLSIASRSPYGMCVTPPQWDIFEIDWKGHDMAVPVLFSAIMLVEWSDGGRDSKDADRIKGEPL